MGRECSNEVFYLNGFSTLLLVTDSRYELKSKTTRGFESNIPSKNFSGICFRGFTRGMSWRFRGFEIASEEAREVSDGLLGTSIDFKMFQGISVTSGEVWDIQGASLALCLRRLPRAFKVCQGVFHWISWGFRGFQQSLEDNYAWFRWSRGLTGIYGTSSIKGKGNLRGSQRGLSERLQSVSRRFSGFLGVSWSL